MINRISKFLLWFERALRADHTFFSRVRAFGWTSSYNPNASDRQTFRKSRQLAARCNTELVVGTTRKLQEIPI